MIVADSKLLELYAARDTLGHVEILGDEHPESTAGLFDEPGWEDLADVAWSVLSQEDRRFFGESTEYDLPSALSEGLFVPEHLAATLRPGEQHHAAGVAHQELFLDLHGALSLPEPTLDRTSSFLYPAWRQTDSIPSQVARETARLARIRARLLTQPKLLDRCFRLAPLVTLARATLAPLLGERDRNAESNAAYRAFVAPLGETDRAFFEAAIADGLWSENTEPLMEATTATFHRFDLTFLSRLTLARA
ncbi:MAG TPA: hypothetical protein VGB92_03565 [Longimicrobium sp.]